MVVTIPLGPRRRLTIGYARRFGVVTALHTRSRDFRLPGDWTDDEPGAGVREPRNPAPQAGGGTIAPPPDAR